MHYGPNSVHSRSSYQFGFLFQFVFGRLGFVLFCFVWGVFWKNGKIVPCAHTQGTLRDHCLQEYSVLRVDHQTVFLTNLQKTDKNLNDRVNKDHHVLCFTDLRIVVFSLKLTSFGCWLPLAYIKFFGHRFRIEQWFGLVPAFKEDIMGEDIKLISLHILKKEKPSHGRTLFFRK